MIPNCSISKGQFAKQCDECDSYFIFEDTDYEFIKDTEIVDMKTKIIKKKSKFLFGFFKIKHRQMVYTVNVVLQRCVRCPICGNLEPVKVEEILEVFEDKTAKEASELSKKFS